MMSNVGAEILARQVEDIDMGIRTKRLTEGEDPCSSQQEIEPGLGYYINILGQVTDAEGNPMKPKVTGNSSFPSVRITRRTERGTQKQDTYKIERLMDKFFGLYIEGYSDTYAVKKEKRLEHYQLIPKDGDRSNTCIDNLKYVERKRSCSSEVTSDLINIVLRYSNGSFTDRELAKIFKTTKKHVQDLRGLWMKGNKPESVVEKGAVNKVQEKVA